jgi:hypothetical protein
MMKKDKQIQAFIAIRLPGIVKALYNGFQNNVPIEVVFRFFFGLLMTSRIA